jgi:DNA-binding transcriptional ArsR family regulator
MTDPESGRAMRELMCVTDAAAGGALLHPLRIRMLELLRTPLTAGELGAELGMSRQKASYHVRELVEHGLIVQVDAAGETDPERHPEKRYRAAARRFLIDPGALGPLAPLPGSGGEGAGDPLGPDKMLTAGSRAQTELLRVVEAAERSGTGRPSTMTIEVDARFATPAARTAFAQALLVAVQDAVRAHGTVDAPTGAGASDAKPYRVLVCCYPTPGEASAS